MDDAVQILLYVLLGAAGLWIIIAAAGALPLLMLAKVKLARLDDVAARPWLQKVFRRGLVEPQWLVDHHFEPQGVFQAGGQVGNPHFIVWRRAGERTYLCVYVVMQTRTEIDLVTAFEEGALTTGTTKDGLTIPGRPGHWMQAFSVKGAEPLWQHHDAGLEFLRQATGQQPSTRAVDFRDDFVDNVRGHVAYVRTIPLWFLRIPYWYFVRRNRLHGKPIRQQFERQGPIAAQQHPTFGDPNR